MLVNASSVDGQTQLWESEEDVLWIAIEPASDGGGGFLRRWFVPRYEAFLVQRTRSGCPENTSALFLANLARQEESGEEEPGEHEMRFIIESSRFVQELGLGTNSVSSADPE